MKKIFILAALVALCVSAQAGGPLSYEVLQVSNVATGALVSTNTAAVPSIGQIEEIRFLITGSAASPTVDVAVAVAAGTAIAQGESLLDLPAATVNGIYPIRKHSVWTNGAAATTNWVPFTMVGDGKLQATYSANVTGITCRAIIIFK